MALNAQILLSILAHETSSGDISQTLRATPATYSLSLANGTGANQAQVVWSDSGTVLAGSDLQFSLSSLADDRGTVSMSSVKLIYIRNTGSIALTSLPATPSDWPGGPFSLTEGSTLSVPPGGALLWSNPSAQGWAVGDPLNQLAFSNLSESTATTYEIIIIGEGTIT